MDTFIDLLLAAAAGFAGFLVFVMVAGAVITPLLERWGGPPRGGPGMLRRPSAER